MAKEINVLAISYAKRALQKGSREQLRMQEYASVLDNYTMVIFTRKKDNLPSKYMNGKLTIYGTNTKTRFGMLLESYRIGKKILKDNCNKKWIVSSQDPFETSVIGRRLSRCFNVVHHVQVHGDPFSNNIWKWESTLNMLRVMYGLYILRKTSLIRVVSLRLKTSLIKKGIRSRCITVLPVLFNLDAFLKIGKEKKYFDNEICTFLFLGRLSHEKNVTRIVSVFASAYQRNVNIRLKIFGDGPCKAEIIEQIQGLDLSSVVSLSAWTENVPNIMAQADILVLASSHEGHGMVILEAMASGLPVISTDVGCVGNILKDRESGIVIDQKNDLLFTDALLLLAENNELRVKLGVTAHKVILSQHKTKHEYLQQWKASFVV